MDEFTHEERARIDYLYGSDFKDIKPEDAQLIARFEVFRAKQDAQFDAHCEAMQAESNANIANAKRVADKAIKNLNELHKRAIARLENMENGI